MPNVVDPSRIVPNNWIYLFHTDEYLLLPEYPDSVADKLTSSFSMTNALSRTAPFFTYVNSGPRNVQINLHLHRDMVDDTNLDLSNFSREEGEDFVDSLVRKLQAIALPVYRDKEVIPPTVAVKIGVEEIFIKGVVIGGVSIGFEKPILENNKYAQVTLSFEVYETEPFDAQSVSQLGSFRGITSQFKDMLD